MAYDSSRDKDSATWPVRKIIAKYGTPNMYDESSITSLKITLECGHVCYVTGDQIKEFETKDSTKCYFCYKQMTKTILENQEQSKQLTEQIFELLKDKPVYVAMNSVMNAAGKLTEHFQVNPVTAIEVYAACTGMGLLLTPASPEDFDAVQEALSLVDMNKSKLN